MSYNPYDLVKLTINGKPIDGRPFEFDSDVADQNSMKNAFDEFVKPKKVATICPDCGQGLYVDVNFSGQEPPFAVLNYSCPYCSPAQSPLIDPFVNPIDSDRISLVELDPLLHDPKDKLVESDIPVAEQFSMPPEPKPEGFNLIPKVGKVNKEMPGILPASDIGEEVGEEVDFDDSDMVDE